MTLSNSIFLSTGTNLGNLKSNLEKAKFLLQKHFILIAESRIYKSRAVDYLLQPDFYNQVLEFQLPRTSAEEAMSLILKIESEIGRNRTIPKGPRVIDIDILFWGLENYSTQNLIVPHPRLFERSFVVYPLSELPGFSILKKNFEFKFHFDNEANPLS